MTPDTILARRRQERLAAVATSLSASPGLRVIAAIGQDAVVPGGVPGLAVSRADSQLEIRVTPLEIEPDSGLAGEHFGGFRSSGADGLPGFSLTAHERLSPDRESLTATASRWRYVPSVDSAVALVREWLADSVATRTPAPVPDLRASRRRLEKVAAAARADATRARLSVDLAAERAAPGITERLAIGAIAWHLPRRTTGKHDPKAVVALVPLGDAGRRPGTREDWVVLRAAGDADGPLRLGVAVESLITENEDHRWNRAPWRWDRTATADSPAIRFGAEPAAIEPVLAALDSGRWDDALSMTGVTLGDDLRRILDGRDASDDTRDLTTAWAARLVDQLANTALWRLADATALLRKQRPVRLFGMGGVNVQRKPGVFLGVSDGRPHLGLEWNASNERLPEPSWARPVELDLVRAGLVDLAELSG